MQEEEKIIDWNVEKNMWLKKERHVSFENVEAKIQEESVIDIVRHPNHKKYPKQKMYIVCIYDYVYKVPFVEDEEKIFLKTIIPSSKLTKKYLKDN